MKRPESRVRLKGLRRACVGVALLTTSHALTAQEQPADTTVLAWSRLREKPAFLDSGSVGVRYPPLLQTANVAGVVRLLIVIGEDGRPIADRTRVDESAHDLFSSSARVAISRWRFTPPVVDGVPVRVAAPVEVSFSVPADLDGPVREVSSVIVDSAELRVLAGWEPLPRAITAPRDTADIKWAKLIVLLELLAMTEDNDTTATRCVRWSDQVAHPLPARMMSRIRAQYSDVVDADACPRTISPDASAKRPKSHVDPIWVGVGSAEPWTPDLYLVRGHVEAARTDDYYCEARRDERGRWGGTCELRSSTTR